MPGEDPTTLQTAQDVAPLLVDACMDTETRHGALIAAPRRTAG
jgi:hypothetical protein